jgi:transcriptional regulator with XRE-family HTH domain
MQAKNSHLRRNMKIFDEKAIIQRIKLLREQYTGGRGRSKFARALGVSSSTYSYYESSRVPPIDVLLKICELTGADLNWLLTGRSAEKKHIIEPENFAFASNKEDMAPNISLLRKLNTFLAQNPDLAEPVTAFIELLCEKKGIEKEIHPGVFHAGTSAAKISPSEPSASRPGWIPVLGRTAAGMVHFWNQTVLPEPRQAVTELDELVKKHIGKTIINSADGTVSIDLQARVLVDSLKRRQANLIRVGEEQEDRIVEFVECEEIYKLFPDSFALQIDGDSMSPRINDGDIVILSPSVPAAQGHIAIIRLANQIGVTCKLIRTTENAVHLIPINERYETKVVAKKDLLWALAVLCHISV